MKKTITRALVVAAVLLCGCTAISRQHTIVFDSAAGTFEIRVISPEGQLEATHQGVGSLIEGTNILCELAVGEDGAVHAITLKNGARVDIDLITRIVDADTGTTNIVNPHVSLDGQPLDIVSAWSKLSKTDARFVVEHIGEIEH